MYFLFSILICRHILYLFLIYFNKDIKIKNIFFYGGFSMEKDFNYYQQPFMDFNMGNPNPDMNELYKDPMFNPIMQYEQAFSYYRYLCMQMDYKIKYKEYEKLCATSPNPERRDNKNS